MPERSRYLPICLDLRGRPVVVVGAGNIGTQKSRDFVECGARVTVVSPAVSAEVRALAEAGDVRLIERAYMPGDIEGAFLVAVATDDPSTNAAVFAEADAAGQLVNVCDDPPNCNYIFASKIERGPLTVSIFTHGAAPAFSRRVRRELESWLGPEYGEMAELIGGIRDRLKALPGLAQPDRQRVIERLVYSELLLLLREGRGGDAAALAEQALAEAVRPSSAEASPLAGDGPRSGN